MKKLKAIFAFGRMNPPTAGHLRIVEKLREEAKREGAVARLYLSKTHDMNRNPLSADVKLAFAQKLFPGVDVRLAQTVFAAGCDMAADGIDDGVMIVGEDRLSNFSNSLTAYAGTDELGLKSIEVKAIQRNDEDASATQMRQVAREGDWESFVKLSPTNDEELTRELYKAVRYSLGV